MNKKRGYNQISKNLYDSSTKDKLKSNNKKDVYYYFLILIN